MPVRLVVYARWKQHVYGIDLDMIESFQLFFNASTQDYTGASGQMGDNLHVEIAKLEEKDRYDIQLTLRSGTTHIDEHTWHNVFVPAVPRFDTKLLRHTLHETDWYYEVHAKG